LIKKTQEIILALPNQESLSQSLLSSALNKLFAELSKKTFPKR
jgi:hypothetical protein